MLSIYFYLNNWVHFEGAFPLINTKKYVVSSRDSIIYDERDTEQKISNEILLKI